mmetsp:Transcript_52263/g.134834  ORF Transcript_52263/g.134834 Transcript_52263/m.134834 type:complete len:201 (-) Transcript_52263:7213-7815(-)
MSALADEVKGWQGLRKLRDVVKYVGLLIAGPCRRGPSRPWACHSEDDASGGTNVEDNGHARKHPLVRNGLRAQLCREHIIRTARRHAVRGTAVHVLVHLVGLRTRFAVDDRHGREHLLRPRVLQRVGRRVPAGTLKEHSGAVCTILRMAVHLLRLPFRNIGVDRQLVELKALILARQLLDGCQEALRVEEPGDVHNLRNV